MMGKDYAIDLMKMVKMAKKGDKPAQLLLALTDTARVNCAISPEYTSEACKQEIMSMLISAAGGSIGMAKLRMSDIIQRLNIIAGWLDAQYAVSQYGTLQNAVPHEPEAIAVNNDTPVPEDEQNDLVERLAKVIVDEIFPIGKESPTEPPAGT